MTDKKEKLSKDELEKIHKQGKKDYKRLVEKDAHNRRAAVNMLKFLYVKQWADSDEAKRKTLGQACLEVNILPKNGYHVTGDMRKNKIQIKVKPEGAGSDFKVAKYREGLIRKIEYKSNAESIYDQAGQMAVDCGYGAGRVLTRWVEDAEDPFKQEVYIAKVENPFCMYVDDDCGFIYEVFSKDEFEDKFPKADWPNSEPSPMTPAGTADEMFWDGKNAKVLEYYYKDKSKKAMVRLSDKRIMAEEEGEQAIAAIHSDYSAQRAANPGVVLDDAAIPFVEDKREIEETKVMWCKFTVDGIIEGPQEWPGPDIPLAMCYGRRTNIEGKEYVYGLHNNSVGAQMMYNYWNSYLAEAVAGQSKTTVWVTPKMLKGFETSWTNSNEENLPFLYYNPDKDSPWGAPHRENPGAVAPGIFTEIQRAEQNVKDTSGVYNADLGDTGRELSGKAILERQKPGDTATFVFPDNQAKFVATLGRIVNNLIPKIYDGTREESILDSNGAESLIPMNMPATQVVDGIKDNPKKYDNTVMEHVGQLQSKEGWQGQVVNDMSKGKYSVFISTGPKSETQRQETAENLVRLALGSKTMSPLLLHLVLKNMDFNGADEAADIVKRTLPAGLIPPKPGEKPLPPPPPPPATQVAMAKLQVAEMDKKVKTVELQIKLLQLKKESSESERGMIDLILKTLTELNMPAGTHPADGSEPEGMQ